MTAFEAKMALRAAKTPAEAWPVVQAIVKQNFYIGELRGRKGVRPPVETHQPADTGKWYLLKAKWDTFCHCDCMEEVVKGEDIWWTAGIPGVRKVGHRDDGQ